MSTTGSSPLNLVKPEANDVVDLAVINTNYDTINTFAANTNTDLTTKAGQITTLNTAVGAAGTVQNSVKATNVAGGLQKQIPIQSAADTTTFIAAPATAGKLLQSTLSSPYAVWNDPVPYKIQTGTVSSTAGGAVSKNFTTAFDVAPIVICTVLGTSSKPELFSLISTSTTGFTGTVWSSNGSTSPYNDFVGATGRTVHFIAIQYLPSQAAS